MEKLKTIIINVSDPVTKEVIVLYRTGPTHYFDEATGGCYCGAVYAEDAIEDICPLHAAAPEMVAPLKNAVAAVQIALDGVRALLAKIKEE